ncbi:MAG: hypothetical protein LBM96_10370 [Methanobrevibacter sp.]|jgi:hypothetical protein|nr:hypothetical protein [Candidatus Methanoflexus mossambicus]
MINENENNNKNNNKKIVHSLSNERIKELDALYNRNYPESVRGSMWRYSKDSNIVNDCFRNHNGKWNKYLEKTYDIDEKEFKNIVHDLDNYHVELVEDTICYRGLKEEITNFKVGDTIPDLGYASTSFDKGVAKYYATNKGTVFCLKMKKGTKGSYIRQNSSRPNEIEFLLPRGSELEIYKINNEVYCILKYI